MGSGVWDLGLLEGERVCVDCKWIICGLMLPSLCFCRDFPTLKFSYH